MKKSICYIKHTYLVVIKNTHHEFYWHFMHHIKEINDGFSMILVLSGEFMANTAHFAIGIMTHNLFIARINKKLKNWRFK